MNSPEPRRGPGVPGPIDIPDEVDFLPSGQRRCTAHVHSTGRRCRSPAIRGAAVCYRHGGAAPQVRRRARLRLAELVDPAVARLGRILVQGKDADAIRAIENVLDRAGYPRKTELDVDTAREILIQQLVEMRDAGEIEDSDDLRELEAEERDSMDEDDNT